MRKIFILSGELSGDKLGAWYLDRLQKEDPGIECHSVGGYFLKKQGAKIFEKMEKLNVSGVFEIARHLPRILKLLNKIASHIVQNNYDELILVDFPGFNLRLAKKVKKSNPNLKITYLSPPQIWIWGEGRIKKLKKYFDRLIVMYPFEVEWYKNRGVKVEFLGNPIYLELKEYFKKDTDELINERLIANQIAILPASRDSELDKLFPFVTQTIKKIRMVYPKVKIILPLARSISKDKLERKLRQSGLWQWFTDVQIIQDEKEKLNALSKCCLAISKPGTISLQLALLGVPTVIFYKSSWLSYFLARLVVNIKYMSLPNLFLPKPIFTEYIQGDCKVDNIFNYVRIMYKKFISKDDLYKKLVIETLKIRQSFSGCQEREILNHIQDDKNRIEFL